MKSNLLLRYALHLFAFLDWYPVVQLSERARERAVPSDLCSIFILFFTKCLLFLLST